MAYSTFVVLLYLAALLHCSHGAILSLGQMTAKPVRSKLPDSAFLIRSNVPAPPSGKDVSTVAADAANTPALAATDTNMKVATNRVKAGRPFFKHYHPRGAEILYVTRGRMNSKLWFEGNNPRMVTNTLLPGDSVIYPQGLIHLVRCEGKFECSFIQVFNSGDPGTVPVA